VRIFRNQKNFSEADLVEVLTPSPHRIAPPCPLFGRCGGCQYQHLAYVEQLAWKRRQVAELLQHLAGVTFEVNPVIGSPREYGYRSKITPHFNAPREPQMAREGSSGFGVSSSELENDPVLGAVSSTRNSEPETRNRSAAAAPLPIGFLRQGTRFDIIDVPHCDIATEAINDRLISVRADIHRRAAEGAFPRGATLLLRDAGGVMLGKTTTPEFGWKGLGDSPLTGITRNPWNIAMTTGGSSAGAGAATAAGFGPIHQGSDGAGSIRIPSGFCGIYGLKPSFGRVPMWPTSNNDYSSHMGPMTRTVADAALMLSVMAGPDDWDRTSLEAAPDDYVGKLRAGIRGLRVAFSPDLGGFPVDAEVAAVVKAAVSVFEELGCVVEEAKPGFADSHDLIRCLWSAHEAGNYAQYLPQWRSQMDPGLVACIEDGQRYDMVDYVEARGQKLAYWDTVRPFFEKFDLLLTPTLSVAAFPVGRLNPEHWPQHAWDWIGWASFSYPFNFTGQPAATVPAGFTPAGLPVGLQIVGRRFADLTVLQASAAFEAARPWAQRRPGVD